MLGIADPCTWPNQGLNVFLGENIAKIGNAVDLKIKKIVKYISKCYALTAKKGYPPSTTRISFTAFKFDAIQDLILVLKDMGKVSPKDKLLSGRIQ